MKFDFSGYATRNNLRCSDGRTILKDAFKADDGEIRPLVWNHQHDSVDNVLGHALLENRDDGVYAYCSFNDTESGQNAKALVQHGDVRALSIYANQLQQRGTNVVHGAIREVSLVLAGANPGAFIESVVEHSDGTDEWAVIKMDSPISTESGQLELKHADEEDKKEEKEESEVADNKKSDSGKTVKDVFDTLNEEQKTVVYALIGQALEEKSGGSDDDDEEGSKDMKHNVFDNEDNQGNVLSHSDMMAVIGDAKRYGSMKESALQHGIDDIDYLFPDYKEINNPPSFISLQPNQWVTTVMNGVHHTPFSRIKMTFADITMDEARARGYIKGNQKVEETFGLLRRTVDPTTIYKKQKFDRDDVVDITDFDIIAWVKTEMRGKLDEEIARAIVFGDGRSTTSDDKIDETKIIPIVSDAELYVITYEVSDTSDASNIIDAAVKAQDNYQGSGNLKMFVPNSSVSDMLLVKDYNQRRIYKDIAELATACAVDSIVKVPDSIVPDDILAVIVDLDDYNVGADKGGAVKMFDDFDIDYNQQKYLIETRCSGALIKPYSAIVLKKGSTDEEEAA
ncbi:MAG: HK97 family phage prohead protease [Lachnospiraceae bacterium]|nr:HK97 family phage prohead protease [Lachnospiraceae bacterium]